MPEYTVIARNGKPLFVGDDAINAQKWLKKHNYKWLVAKFELAEGEGDPKTAEQRGYYFGLLLPEIHKQFLREGMTETITFYSEKRHLKRDIPIRKMTAHEIITDLCGRIGDDGAPLRLSTCDKHHCQKFIDNVLDFASELGMNIDRLKAARLIEL